MDSNKVNNNNENENEEGLHQEELIPAPIEEIQAAVSNNNNNNNNNNTYRPMNFVASKTNRSRSMSRSKTRSKSPSKTYSRPSNTTRKNVKGNSAALQKKVFYILQDAIAKTDKMNAKSASAFITNYFLIKKYGKTPLGDHLRSFVNSGKLNQTKFITPGHHKGAIANAVKATKRLS